MQTARGFVVVTIKLATSVQHRQHGFQCRFFSLGVLIDRNPATVIGHGDALAIFVQLKRDLGRVAVHRFVDRVIQDLPDQVMQTRRTHAADIHPWSLANRFQALQDNDVVAFVFFSHVRCRV